MNAGLVSAMVDYPIGDLVAERVKAMGVRSFYKRFKHNGVNGPNIAAVYSDRGHGVRAPVVFYNRSNEAAAQLKPGDSFCFRPCSVDEAQARLLARERAFARFRQAISLQHP